MTYDEFVQRPQVLNNRILHQIEKAERLQTLCTQATAIYSDLKVQTSHGNKREKWLTAYIDSKDVLTDLMEQQEAAANDLREWLYSNMDVISASMLEFRYCDGLKSDDIADRLHYSPEYMRKKISKAIQTARQVYSEQKERA